MLKVGPQGTIQQITYWLRNIIPPELGILVPISGGTDSALAFWLCNRALPQKTIGVFSGINLRCEDWFREHGEIKKISATDTAHSDNPEINRWASFLVISLRENKVLVGTRNRTEDVLGSYSLASRLATCLPLINLWKTDVLYLCRHIGIPKEIIDSSGQADPFCGRPEELASIPIEIVDTFLKVKEGEFPESEIEKLHPDQTDFLETRIKKYAFKRKLPMKCPF